MMPPATGLPTPRPRNLPPEEPAPLSGMLGAIPEATVPALHGDPIPETAVHGD